MNEIVIRNFQHNFDNDLNNDGVDEDMIVGWVEDAIKKGNYNEASHIVVRDCFFSVAIPLFLSKANASLEHLSLESNIEYSYLATPSYSEDEFDGRCIDAICKNTNLTSLKSLNVFGDLTDEMKAKVADAPHLQGLVLGEV